MYATPQELSERAQRTITVAFAERLLTDVSAGVDAVLGFKISPAVTGETIRVRTNDTPRLYLGEATTAVTQVEDDGGVVPATQYDFDPDTGILERLEGKWRARRSFVRVTRSRGFATPPPIVKTIVLTVAARAVDNPTGGIKQETLGDASITYTGFSETGVFFTEEEERQLLTLIDVGMA